ncbi:RNAse R [Pacificibacter maritimus]|uniref:Ribonuclease R n=1 Tax=Pacificibacter maritimus TaxID=762213 RepID=A0A3N4TX59_9RHOB|nr:ribonuclease R [Pacificibacter maritimus]RPE63106.1 RNAse R [Pacificibacter maritimus]
MSKIPTKQAILDWISEHPTKAAKRDIAKAFGIKGAARIDLKRMLKELEAEGHLTKRVKTYRDPDKLPPVSVLEILAPDTDGDIFALPLEWTGTGSEPRILMVLKESDPALGAGERILAKLQAVKAEDHAYQARLIRKIGSNPEKILGIYRANAEGGRVVPIDKGAGKEWLVRNGQDYGAEDGELVEAEQTGPKDRMGLPRAKIIARLGDPTAPRAVSLIAIHQHNIPDAFPDNVISMADAAKPAGLASREDMRDVPLVTIDPEDARDHDDAIWAELDTDSNNLGGFILWVAIADVAHYVTSGSALDKEARTRGNSTYFPDRVVPMLPDRLSGDLCSLHEGVPRPCLAVRMKIDARGEKISHEFTRGLMRSAASLNYQEVQAAQDGAPNDTCAPLMDTVITPLYQAYKALKVARENRQPLELDLPERKIVLGEDGKVSSVAIAERLDAHRMIEEFMVLANVAAAEELFQKNRPLLYRVHEEPSDEKMESLREVALGSGLNLAKGQVLHTSHLNRLLKQAAGTDHSELINISTLRSMTQAYYHPQNYGHFGLALRSYAHFTSPIRRYADLIVHRALISAHGWGDDGLSAHDIETLEDTAKQISDTERRSMVAERDTNDRYLAAYLSERLGTEMTGHISGIQKFGAFIKLDETGADGLAPVRSMGSEFFHFDPDAQTLMGSSTGITLSIGQRVVVRVAEATPVTGGLELEVLEVNGMKMPRSSRRARGKPASRKHARSKAKRDKIKKKVSRKRS